MICLRPREARADHLLALLSAGLTVPQVIALSELLAFVNFESRIIDGLSLLEPTS